MLILAVCHLADCHTFTTRSGTSFDADVIGAYGTVLFLQLEGDRNGSIDVRALIDKDVEYVTQWAKEYEKVRANLPLVKDSKSELTQFLKENLYNIKNGKLEKYDFSEKKEPEFYAFYSSASWCGPCRQFSPKLVNFYNGQKEFLKRDNFEIILLSSDDGSTSMRKYMEDEKMKWPTVKYSKARDKIFERFRGPGIPCLVITDRNGNVLKHTYVGGKYEGPTKTMQFLKEMLTLTNDLPEVDYGDALN